MTVSVLLEQPCDKSDSLIKLVTSCSLLVLNLFRQLGASSVSTLIEDLIMYFFLTYLSLLINLSRVLMLVATLSLQEKPRVSLKKFVKIGRPGYKGKNAEDSR